MRHVGRNENEIAGVRLGSELQPLAPAHPRLASDHVDNAFEMTVMMRAGLGVGFDGHGTGPQFLRANTREVNRGLAIHAWSRWYIRIELIAGNHTHAVALPTLGDTAIIGVSVVLVV